MFLSNDGLVQDRFQGAVIGLWMVPIALASETYGKGSSLNSSVESSNLTIAKDEIACYLTQIDAFLHDPWRFKLSLPEAISPLSSLPLLLRYSSDHSRRYSAVFSLLTEGMLEQNAQRLIQILVLGDVLSMVLNASALPINLPSLAALNVRASECGLSSIQRSFYTDLWQMLRDRILHGSSTVADEVIEGIAIALAHPSDYPAAVCTAQKDWAVKEVSTTPNTLAISGIVAGVVAGAMGGRTSLPVLWQMHSYSEQSCLQRTESKKNCTKYNWEPRQVVNLANRLFSQWAGVVRKSHTIIAK